MQFKPYTHIEKYGETSVKNITIGDCYIFPKIDGSNGCIYMGDDGQIKAGGRKRELTLENDNKGFYAYVLKNEIKYTMCMEHLYNMFSTFANWEPNVKNVILYGEWLVPHTIRSYDKEAFNCFYIFDVYLEYGNTCRYLSFEDYSPILKKYEIKYVPPITKLTNPRKQDFVDQLDKATFLNGDKAGEGIVIKNYDKQLFAKIVSSEFREQHEKTFFLKKEQSNTPLEQMIAEYFTTTTLCEKEYAKIINETQWNDKLQLKLLHIIFYNLIKEEGWEIIKKYKNPTIDYNKLQYYVFEVVKQKLPELFNIKVITSEERIIKVSIGYETK